MTSRSESGDREPASAGSRDPERLVAAAIADLPERFEDYSLTDLKAGHGVTGTLLGMQAIAMQDERAVLDRILPRLERDDQTIREVATEAEVVELSAVVRRYLAVERAQAAWAEYERRIGVPWPIPEIRMTTSEEPDGSLVMVLPGTDS